MQRLDDGADSRDGSPPRDQEPVHGAQHPHPPGFAGPSGRIRNRCGGVLDEPLVLRFAIKLLSRAVAHPGRLADLGDIRGALYQHGQPAFPVGNRGRLACGGSRLGAGRTSQQVFCRLFGGDSQRTGPLL